MTLTIEELCTARDVMKQAVIEIDSLRRKLIVAEKALVELGKESNRGADAARARAALKRMHALRQTKPNESKAADES
jgi:hypothetical protein